MLTREIIRDGRIVQMLWDYKKPELSDEEFRQWLYKYLPRDLVDEGSPSK